jgi:REP element-mobilizing transposase RayT
MDARPKRRSIRLRGYDYSRSGAYFVSICTKDRTCLFGDIDNQQMALNDAGRMVEKWYVQLENKFEDIRCDEYIIMPNHFHAIIQNTGPVGADLCVCPYDSRHGRTSGEHTGSPLQRVIQWFKTMTTNEYIRGVKQYRRVPFPGRLWQRNYYEHIVRNENEMSRIRKYIRNNPAQWDTDKDNPFVEYKDSCR